MKFPLEILIKKCKENDYIAQRELYNLYAKKLFPICIRYSDSREEAEDLLQESFVRIFFNIRSYSGEGSFEGWVKRIVINLAIRKFHKKKNIFSSSESISENADDYASKDTSQSTYSDGMSNLNFEELMKCVDLLPTGKKMVFNLYAIEGYTHKEISEMLNISEGTSKSQLAKARELLQQHYTQNEMYARRTS
jgi:RNA polymerase sigma-70 factor (ECF subfamily)